jgi:hypothetical protein
MRKLIFFLASALLASAAHANTLDFPQAGFSIDSIDAVPSLAGGQPLQMFLPPENGFSANINVQIQPYPGTMEQYLELSESQFKQMGLTVISSKVFGETSFFECAGLMQGMELHFYAKAVKKGDFVYLATATDSKHNWDSNKNKLISAIDSLKLK